MCLVTTPHPVCAASREIYKLRRLLCQFCVWNIHFKLHLSGLMALLGWSGRRSVSSPIPMCRKEGFGLPWQPGADPLLKVERVGVHSLPVWSLDSLGFSMEERDPQGCTWLAARPDRWFHDNEILEQFSFYQFLLPLLELLPGLSLISSFGPHCSLSGTGCSQKLCTTLRMAEQGLMCSRRSASSFVWSARSPVSKERHPVFLPQCMDQSIRSFHSQLKLEALRCSDCRECEQNKEITGGSWSAELCLWGWPEQEPRCCCPWLLGCSSFCEPHGS